MRLWALVAVTWVVIFTESEQAAELPTIEFLFSMNDRPGDGYRLDKAIDKFPAFARTAVKICVSGMWALYNNEKYGINSATNTTSIAAQGTSADDCTTTPVGDLVRTIRSLRPLITDLALPSSGCVMWKYKNFIDESMPALDSAVQSCTVTGEYMNSGAFPINTASFTKIMGMGTTCACVDAKKFPFYIADPDVFPNAVKPLRKITAAPSTCATINECTAATLRFRNGIFPYFTTD